MKSKNSEDNDPSFYEDIDFFPGPRGPLTEKRKQEIARALEASHGGTPMKNRNEDEIMIKSGIESDEAFDLKFREMLDTRRHERVILAGAKSKFIAVKFLLEFTIVLAGIYFLIKLFIE